MFLSIKHYVLYSFMMVKKLGFLMSFVCLFILFSHLSKEYHRQFPIFDWHSEIWADKAGYYVYLPATFLYGFKADNFPNEISTKTGFGFSKDSLSGKIITRYTYGVALLEAPFFLINHGVEKMQGRAADGFSSTYNRCINDASAFYACLGIFTLILFLRKYHGLKEIVFAVSTLFFGTGLYFYTLKETGMSHIFSFGLFGSYLLVAQKTIVDFSRFKIALLSILIGIMILLRITNVLFAVAVFFIEVNSWNEFKERIRNIIDVKNSLILLMVLFFIFLPQCLYWHYISGKFIYYSYGESTFTEFLDPRIMEVLFSAGNSLFLYGPINILIFTSSVLYFRQPGGQNKMPLIFLIIMIYVSASWFQWNFGCAYGARNLTEWIILMAIPWTVFWKKLLIERDIVKVYSMALILVLVLWNVALIKNYDGCWFGKNDWDYAFYFSMFKQ